MPKFPRLKADGFPYLDNAEPFRRKVEFDYSRYDYTASIKLCTVSWPSDYRHCVEWADEDARDSYLDSLDGHMIELSNGVLRPELESIRVEVPYDVALTYNYAVMRIPQITEDAPIRHESKDGIRTICAFIADAVYQSPSTTELLLQTDVWTTYLPYKAVRSVMLARGHAPMYAVPTDQYLLDPITNASWLLAPDVTAGQVPQVVKASQFVPVSTAEPVMILASTIPYGAIDSIPRATSTQGSTSASFYDLQARNGYQVGVSGFVWSADGHDYAGMQAPATPTRADGSVTSGLYYYGILGSAVASGALAQVSDLLPVLIASCQAAYIVPSDLVTLGTTHAVGTVTLYNVSSRPGLQDMGEVRISKDMFGYPARYREMAKLYTWPYASLEISDDLGNAVPVRIEETTGTVTLEQQLSAAYPFLSWRMMATNVASLAGEATYIWKSLSGASVDKSVPGADFAAYAMELGIPTYALYLAGAQAAAMGGYYGAQAERLGAIVGYQSGARSANTAHENTLGSNVTAKSNADASADVSVTNTANSGRNSQANTTLNNNNRTAKTAQNNTTQTALNTDAIANIYDSSNADLEYATYAQDVNLKSDAIASIQNLVGNAVAGNAMGVLNAGVSGILNITTSQTLASLSFDNILDHQAISQGHTNTASGLHIANATQQTALDNMNATATTDNNVNTQNTNAQNSANVAKTNATRTKATGDANSGYSRGTSIENGKASLLQAQVSYNARMADAGMGAAVPHGASGGDARADAWQERGAHVRVKTTSPGAIKQVGDAFLRYGYAFDGIWDISAWVPQGHDFCYWQASDIWAAIADYANPRVESNFEDILMRGVTVWADPEKIGAL